MATVEPGRRIARTIIKGRVPADDPLLPAIREAKDRKGVSESFIVREGAREYLRRELGMKVGDYPARKWGRPVMDGRGRRDDPALARRRKAS